MITNFKLFEYNNNMSQWFSDSVVVNDDGEPLVVYHGTMDDIIEFDDRYCGDTTCNNEFGGFYFSDNKNVAEDYSRQAFIRRYDGRDKEELVEYYNIPEKKAEAIVNNIEEVADEQIHTIDVFLKMEKPYIMDGEGGVADIAKTQKLINILKNKTFDGDSEGLYFDLLDKYEISEEEIEENREEIEDLARENNSLEEDEDIDDWMFDDAKRDLLTNEDDIFDYDGIIYKNCIDDISEASQIINDVYIVFHPNQIKSIESKRFADYSNNIFESNFYEPQYSVVAHTGKEFEEIINKPNNQKLSKRIRFFNYGTQDDAIFFTLYADDLIIGINKIMKVKSTDDEYRYDYADYVISYFSIDRDFRNKKLSRLLMESMFSWLKENNYSAVASTEWSVPGNQRLKSQFHKMGIKYNIKTFDRKEAHDTKSQYNDDLIHKSEMTEDELKKFNKKNPPHTFNIFKNLNTN